jgi:hypothetical protein
LQLDPKNNEHMLRSENIKCVRSTESMQEAVLKFHGRVRFNFTLSFCALTPACAGFVGGQQAEPDLAHKRWLAWRSVSAVCLGVSLLGC